MGIQVICVLSTCYNCVRSWRFMHSVSSIGRCFPIVDNLLHTTMINHLLKKKNIHLFLSNESCWITWLENICRLKKVILDLYGVELSWNNKNYFEIPKWRNDRFCNIVVAFKVRRHGVWIRSFVQQNIQLDSWSHQTLNQRLVSKSRVSV